MTLHTLIWYSLLVAQHFVQGVGACTQALHQPRVSTVITRKLSAYYCVLSISPFSPYGLYRFSETAQRKVSPCTDGSHQIFYLPYLFLLYRICSQKGEANCRQSRTKRCLTDTIPKHCSQDGSTSYHHLNFLRFTDQSRASSTSAQGLRNQGHHHVRVGKSWQQCSDQGYHRSWYCTGRWENNVCRKENCLNSSAFFWTVEADQPSIRCSKPHSTIRTCQGTTERYCCKAFACGRTPTAKHESNHICPSLSVTSKQCRP